MSPPRVEAFQLPLDPMLTFSSHSHPLHLKQLYNFTEKKRHFRNSLNNVTSNVTKIHSMAITIVGAALLRTPHSHLGLSASIYVKTVS